MGKKYKEPTFRVINRDKDGKIIKDMSKVVLPDKLAKEIFELLNPNYEAK